MRPARFIVAAIASAASLAVSADAITDATASPRTCLIDTCKNLTVTVGETVPIAYSSTLWGDLEASGNFRLSVTRAGGSSILCGEWTDGAGAYAWTPKVWGTNTLAYQCGSTGEVRTVVVEGPVGSGTATDPYVVADDTMVLDYTEFRADDTVYLQAVSGFVPSFPASFAVTSEGNGIYAVGYPGATASAVIDTYATHVIAPGTVESLRYSDTAWGATNVASPVAIVRSRNGGESVSLGEFPGDGAVSWSAPYWGTNVLTYVSEAYSTSHVFVVTGMGSGRKTDPYLVTGDEDVAAFLPRDADGYAYLTPYGDYKPVAPSGYMLEYQFGLYRLSHYIAPSLVKVTAVRQRYPWNGLVDVAYTITGTLADHRYSLEFYVQAGGVVKSVPCAANLPRSDGDYAVTLDLSGEFPESYVKDATISAVLSDLGADGSEGE